MAENGVEYAALIGLDWADKKHDLAFRFAGTDTVRCVEVGSRPEQIRQCLLSSRERCPEGRFAVCLEQSRGTVVNALGGMEFVDLYPVNPKSVKSFRETFFLSGAKDDPGDAALMLEILIKHQDRLKKLEPDTELTRQLAALCELRRKTVDRRTDVTNELVSVLKQYYPQALTLIGDNRHSKLACAVLMKWPRFTDIAGARDQTIRTLYYANHCRSEKRIRERLDCIRSGVALTTDPAVVEPLVLHVRSLVGQIRLLNDTVKGYEGNIVKLFAQHPDAFIFRSLPGAGAQLAPRMLAALGTHRERYRRAVDMSTYTGIAPVTERSGKSTYIHWRWRCPKFLRQTFVEFAAKSIGQSRWAEVYYREQRSRGKGHNAALRALAFKWQRIIFRCWQNREAYDEAKYIKSLKKHGSWLAERLEKVE